MMCEEEAALGCSTSIMAAKILARVKGLEGLPQDDLKEIMIHVARQPGGVFDIARAFTVCKTFANFAEDRTVLQAVSFEGFFRNLPRDYELFFNTGGLVARCARAGNIEAHFILAKVVMVSASNLCCSKMDTIDGDRFVGRYCPLTSCDLDSASRLLDHFSARGTDPTELLDLVRNFLSRAKYRDLVEMQHHLNNFVALYLDRGKTLPQHEFIVILNKLCESPISRGGILDLHAFFAEQLNEISRSEYNVMKDMGVEEALIRPLIEGLVCGDDGIDVETLIKRVGVIEPIIKMGVRVALKHDITEEFNISQGNAIVGILVKRQLRALMDHEVFVESARESLLASFDALFSK